MYEMSIDRCAGLMTVRVSGFWDETTFAAYAAEAAGHAEALVRAGGFRALLIDMSDFPTQAALVADLHGKLLQTAQARYGVRVAIVMRSALSRLQAMRVAKITGSELFGDHDEARAALEREPAGVN